MSSPTISVVMSVYNGEKCLAGTVESILSQTFGDFEFIIIDDGSTDRTAEILEAYVKKDNRIRVFHQENLGLTKALIRGCAEARGEFIARQDCGDISRSERFAKQLEHIRSRENRVLVSCATDFFGPGHEFLYRSSGKVDDEEVRDRLLKGSVKTIRGLAGHGSAFFKKDLYEKVGGYRSEFYFAQDVDLWVRLARQGKVSFCPEVLFEVRVSAEEISGGYYEEQMAVAKIILELRDLQPGDPKSKGLLFKASLIRPKKKLKISRMRKARGLYFIAQQLKAQGHKRTRGYLKECIRCNPFHIKAWLSLFGVL